MALLLALGTLLAHCRGSDDDLNDGGGAGDADTDGDTDTDTDADSDDPADCPAQALGNRLGRSHLFVGGSMTDESFDRAPFDIRYQYLAGNVPAEGPCANCAENCYVDGQSCANDAGCPWWGCWQWDQDPPGRFVNDFVTKVAEAGGIPMITYYIWYSVAGDVEGAAEIARLNEAARLSALLADYRFMLRVIAETPHINTLLHVEPDLWGYAHQVSADPSTIPVALSGVGAPECAAMANTIVGLVRCFAAIAHAEAPNVFIGFHASAWGAGHDALVNSDPNFDLEGHAQATASFMTALGAADADFIVVEMSDRDAGFNNRWWDATDTTLPHFSQAIEWVGALGEAMALAPLWWQVPYGHPGLDDVCDRYRDNRVDYFFAHPMAFANAGSLGIAFGAGAPCMTTAETDGGNFLGLAADYFNGDRPPLCGVRHD